MENKLKLLILALDGATPRFIDEHSKMLPHFSSLFKTGTRGIVTGPPFSCDRWFTYYSGLRPEEHGLEAMRLSIAGRVNLSHCKAKNYLWDYITKAGFRFGMLGGLGCEPPVEAAAFWVNFYYDKFYPEKAQQYCTNIWRPVAPYPICEAMGRKTWDKVDSEEVVNTLSQFDWSILVNWVKQRQQRQLQTLDNLMIHWPVDVLWYYAFELDWSQHLAAHRPDTLVECYQVLDDTLGYIRAKYRPDIVLVISDHGVTPIGLEIPYANLKALPGVGACIPLKNKNTFWTGEHHSDSFYALSGPGVPKGGKTNIDFIQIFPLILEHLGIAVPKDLPGKPPSLQSTLVRGQQSNQELWKVRAPLYSQLQWVQREDLLALMLSHCGVTKKDRVLDLGTGTGAVACAIASHTDHVMGIDSEPAMLEQAKPLCPNVEFRLMDVQQLDLPDRCVDLVTARMVLHHVEDLGRALAEARRVLTDGGRIVLCEGVPPSPLVLKRYTEIFALKEPGRHIFTEDKLDKLLKEAGFVNISLSSYLVPQVSMKNWLSSSGLPEETCSQIAQLHWTADSDFWKIYNMKENGDDLLMDWKFVVVKGIRQ